MLNVCDVCGYDYRNSGDSAHTCGESWKFFGFGSKESWETFLRNPVIKVVKSYPLKLNTGPKKNETVVEHKYATGGILHEDIGPELSLLEIKPTTAQDFGKILDRLSKSLDNKVNAALVGDTGPELINLRSFPLPSTYGPNNRGICGSGIKELQEWLDQHKNDTKPVVVETENKLDPKLAGRFDQGKVDWSQLPLSALEGMVRVLEFGAKKYAKGNWANGGGFDHSRVFNSLMRHLVSYQGGEDLDPESGLPHLDHIMCNAMFNAYYKKNPETFNKDDRVDWPKDAKFDPNKARGFDL